MIVTYRPDGQDEPTTWTIDLDNDFRSKEMELVESLTKLEFGSEFILAVMRKGAKARRALLFVLLSRKHPKLKFADLDFTNNEMLVEMDKDEWAKERLNVEQSTQLDPATKTERLEMIDLMLAQAPDAPGKSPAPSVASDGSTD